MIEAALSNGGHDNVTVAMANVQIQTDEEDKSLPNGTVGFKKRNKKKMFCWFVFILLLLGVACFVVYEYYDGIYKALSNIIKR